MKPDKEVISFIHLYDNHFGYFPKYAREWIVFPQDFIPSTNKKYECQIQWTMFGMFKFNGKNYRVARAYPIDHGNMIDVIHNKIESRREYWGKIKPQKQSTSMELAFKKANK